MKENILLTLYKQHYLDRYTMPLEADFSCLGYYDGLSITEVKRGTKSKISQKRSNAPMPELWYVAGERIEAMKGGYSNQNIGLFRCFSDEKMNDTFNAYWEMEKNLPFLHVGFVKLQRAEQYETVGKKIEGIYTELTEEKLERICSVIAYCTYDNADLVILAKGNCLKQMNAVFRKIEAMEEISYLHSIVGIDEEYICACTNEKKILDRWGDKACFINEGIDRIEMRLVTSGEKKVLNMIKAELEKWNETWTLKGYNGIKYSYIAGHGNINLIIPGTNVATLLVMLLKTGFATHQNVVYENGLYNIESSIVIGEESLENIKAEAAERDEEADSVGWCRTVMKECTQYLSRKHSKEDESLYSYFQALLQTLNTLDQYERFGMSRDIFDLVFPSFKMFIKKTKKVISGTGEQRDRFEVEAVKEAMWQYLEDVNSVIYHTIHTDQIYLMIPGYSGTSFSIPIKLSMFYSWFLQRVIDVSNDGKRSFGCILVPVTESKPSTCAIKMSENETEILICVRLSRRSLYFPRNLMMILAHELGHYISSKTRCRKKRLQCMIRTLIFMIREKIFPRTYEGEVTCDREQEIFDGLRSHTRRQIQEALEKVLRSKDQLNLPDDKYHAKDIEEPLVAICTKLVSTTGVGSDVRDGIYKIPFEVAKYIEKDEESYVTNMRYIFKIQKHIDNNREKIFASGSVRNYVRVLIEVYQEVFADVFALAVLKCDKKTYYEAYGVSEGLVDPNGNRPIQQKVREWIVENVVFQCDIDASGKTYWRSESYDVDTRVPVLSGEDENEAAEILMYELMRKQLYQYASECYAKVQEWVGQNKNLKEVESIRNVYGLFMSNTAPASQIYNQMNQCIAEYKIGVGKLYDGYSSKNTTDSGKNV